MQQEQETREFDLDETPEDRRIDGPDTLPPLHSNGSFGLTSDLIDCLVRVEFRHSETLHGRRDEWVRGCVLWTPTVTQPLTFTALAENGDHYELAGTVIDWRPAEGPEPQTESEAETRKHIRRVQELCNEFAAALIERGRVHDASKLESPEKELFETVSKKLHGLTYGSPEYDANKAELTEALSHHYEHNSHHPEFHQRGINGMDLLDLVEMFLDWKAAGERHADGSLRRSIEHNLVGTEEKPPRWPLEKMTVAMIFENTRIRNQWK